jgi:hypothetical protein
LLSELICAVHAVQALDIVEECLNELRTQSAFPLPETKCYLTPHEHPVEGFPVLILKVCQLEHLMSLALSVSQKTLDKTTQGCKMRLETQALRNSAEPSAKQLAQTTMPRTEPETKSGLQKRAKGTEKNVSLNEGLRYLGCWLGIVAPYVGLRVTACNWAKLLETSDKPKAGSGRRA